VIRLVGLVVLALLALAVGGYALVRGLLSWRAERRKRQVMRDAQREAESRDSLRLSRQKARQALAVARAEDLQRQEREARDAARVEAYPRGRPVTINQETLDRLAAMPQAPDDSGEWPAIKAGGLVEVRSDGMVCLASQESVSWLGCASTTRTDGGDFSIREVSLVPPEPAHPLGWTVVALSGARLAAVSPPTNVDDMPPYKVDRYESPACAWSRVFAGDPIWREAVEAVGA
jgi:hypothetical protein